jgi:hypothetical protein
MQMKPARFLSLLAATVVAVAVGTATPAMAGYSTDLASDIDCDTATGEWVVQYTLRGDNSSSNQVFGGSWELTAPDNTKSGGEFSFTPPAIDEENPTYATLRLPGAAAGTLRSAADAEFTTTARVTDELDGSCAAIPDPGPEPDPEPDPTPSTAPTPPTLPAEPASMITAVPTYTG